MLDSHFPAEPITMLLPAHSTCHANERSIYCYIHWWHGHQCGFSDPSPSSSDQLPSLNLKPVYKMHSQVIKKDWTMMCPKAWIHRNRPTCSIQRIPSPRATVFCDHLIIAMCGAISVHPQEEPGSSGSSQWFPLGLYHPRLVHSCTISMIKHELKI